IRGDAGRGSGQHAGLPGTGLYSASKRRAGGTKFRHAPMRPDWHTLRDPMKQSAESQKLRANEERLQLALAAAHSGVWDWDMTREAADVSPSYREMFGLPSDYPVTYDAWLAAVHPEDRDRCRAYGEAFFAGPETEWRLEFRIVNPKTGVRWQRAVGRVYRDVHGKPLRFIGVNTDITEEHRALAA